MFLILKKLLLFKTSMNCATYDTLMSHTRRNTWNYNRIFS